MIRNKFLMFTALGSLFIYACRSDSGNSNLNDSMRVDSANMDTATTVGVTDTSATSIRSADSIAKSANAPK